MTSQDREVWVLSSSGIKGDAVAMVMQGLVLAFGLGLAVFARYFSPAGGRNSNPPYRIDAKTDGVDCPQ